MKNKSLQERLLQKKYCIPKTLTETTTEKTSVNKNKTKQNKQVKLKFRGVHTLFFVKLYFSVLILQENF